MKTEDETETQMDTEDTAHWSVSVIDTVLFVTYNVCSVICDRHCMFCVFVICNRQTLYTVCSVYFWVWVVRGRGWLEGGVVTGRGRERHCMCLYVIICWCATLIYSKLNICLHCSNKGFNMRFFYLGPQGFFF